MVEYEFFSAHVECSGFYGYASAMMALSCVTGLCISSSLCKNNSDFSWCVGEIRFKAAAGSLTKEAIVILEELTLNKITRSLPQNNRIGAVFTVRKV